MRPRTRASPSGSDASDTDKARAQRRQPFRPLQSRSPKKISTPAPTMVVPPKSTPPREIEIITLPHTPRATPKPTKRKATSRLKQPANKVKVKSEPPEIDPSKALRPPSPTDDPLLLSGGRGTRSPPLRARLTPAFSSSPSDGRFDDPPLSFTARLSGGRVGQPSGTPASNALPVFNASRPAHQNKTRVKTTQMQAQARPNDGWSDSDSDDEFNLRGEYTGKYKVLRVPTKVDPPTSGSQERTESWGRPVSPFPYSEIMERSLPLSDFPEEDDVDDMIALDDPSAWEVASEPPPSDEPSPSPSVDDEFGDLDDFGDLDGDFDVFEAGLVDAESTEVRPLVLPSQQLPDSDQTVLEEEEEEAQIDRELSVAVDDYPDVPDTLPEVQPTLADEDEEEGSSDDGEDVEGDVIKITSGDAKAAARAAAILRMHDYDCFLAAERKKRAKSRKRRRTVENGGVSKLYTDSRQGRQTIEGMEISPNSRGALLELWQDVEDSVFLEHHSKSYCDASFNLSPFKTKTTRPEPQLPPPAGRWNRDCWKSLDKCLTAERLAISAAGGDDTDLLASTGEISKDSVLERFITQLGGESVLAGLGPDWSRHNLIMRLDVLIKKQSRYATKTSLFTRQDSYSSLDSTVPRYHGLLQEAMALSWSTDLYSTSASASSDATLVSAQDSRNKSLPDPLPCPDPGWQFRGPIRTPSRTPELRAPHPKDQVHLRHASLPNKSMIPVPLRPKRLVDLRHLSPSKFEREGSAKLTRLPTRRSSGFSVKDLVKQFEGLDESVS